MRSVVLEAWKLAIAEAMARLLPEFSLYPRREAGEPRNLLRFLWSPRPALHCFVVFRPIESEAFDAWIGWSIDGRCPFVRPQGPDAFRNFESPAAMCSTIDLVPRSGTAHWSFWDAPQSLLADPTAFGAAYAAHFGRPLSLADAQVEVLGAVEAGLSEVVRYGVPYLQQRAAHAM
jgi:hypothetical protein